jgi:hypothetical protein
MAGGIQPGTVATDKYAKKLDKQLKDSAQELKSYFADNDRVVHQKKLRKDQIPGGKGSCEPDGGVWFVDGKLVAVFEAKKQNLGGNAIERWYNNNFTIRKINSNASYVTFATGIGAQEDEVIGKTLNIAHLNGFNKLIVGDNSTFLSPSGFNTKFIKDIMVETIDASL